MNELLIDGAMRNALGAEDDAQLATALHAVEQVSHHDGARYYGFVG